MIKTTLTTWLMLVAFAVQGNFAHGQEDVQPAPKSQTLKVKVVDEEEEAIEGASLEPSHVEYQQSPEMLLSWIDSDASATTNDHGEATLVFPVGREGPITKVQFHVKHNSFIGKTLTGEIADELVSVTLKRGVQVAASALDPVTKEPIKQDLYAWTNLELPTDRDLVDWNQKSNGTLVSPLIGKDETSLRLVQLDDGKAIRFSKLVDIRQRGKSRLRFSDLEMVDAVTVTGKLGDEVPRPVKCGMVMSCVASISQTDHASAPWQPTWCWKTSSEINRDGTFTLEGIPANSTLQVYCACRGWANKPLTQEQASAEFPKQDNLNFSLPLPQLFQIGEQDTEITVSMQPLGRVMVVVIDQDNQLITEARVVVSLSKHFLYSGRQTPYTSAPSSVSRLTQLRHQSGDGRLSKKTPNLEFSSPVEEEPTDFQTEFSYPSYSTGGTGSFEIDGVPAGRAQLFVSSLGDDRDVSECPSATTWVNVKSNQKVSSGLKLDLTVFEDGGDDD